MSQLETCGAIRLGVVGCVCAGRMGRASHVGPGSPRVVSVAMEFSSFDGAPDRLCDRFRGPCFPGPTASTRGPVLLFSPPLRFACFGLTTRTLHLPAPPGKPATGVSHPGRVASQLETPMASERATPASPPRHCSRAKYLSFKHKPASETLTATGGSGFRTRTGGLASGHGSPNFAALHRPPSRCDLSPILCSGTRRLPLLRWWSPPTLGLCLLCPRGARQG